MTMSYEPINDRTASCWTYLGNSLEDAAVPYRGYYSARNATAYRSYLKIALLPPMVADAMIDALFL